MDDIKELQRLTYEARNKFWAAVGKVDSDVFAPLINPAFSGGPKWPSLRQAYRKIVTNDGVLIIASDGLSDPFEDTPDKKSKRV
ncbi:hypothetical protein A2715_03225 [Candidatus Woesebacteria bacterium RIFCSPHIGHO2_01_FULL_39_32]|uniref:Uncharacterized protein n=2 Tax=Candidatus Woeseibacteriota TaxID=1752722 RepID=A0A0G0PQS9_9BACT|nr:MAG: hypothetical protein UT61_C0009G0001 [Candidatus Woesebacteria bacterium GW2011_GWA1_39_8]OGM04364.1 MAG: hypothetical protein A2124_02825 [Candidatus Woesebacteria bacterium GWB1_37_5]OGM24750.1 MAG: hypothetical protein A2715_03225 [Candidatus Woesebacteria bacterium RIFCSPHIGHO2_01_FULL_39_32]OGM35700.1 MAG: hypothetical protein A3F01_06040 [Candidatus Woesebacteria bacterium RIFCSPHIGHO2_12_FULL_38_11]OGM64576.1 MAG: hypothetical protein A2893_06140 [Candidatus Woesebacteria bacteri